ncbi:hypothetical protein C8R46DRAFT_1246329 [Mycena filopes]|nr:hypothetical protein C8R46DRAFT_1246329 [Mycena filopes]
MPPYHFAPPAPVLHSTYTHLGFITPTLPRFEVLVAVTLVALAFALIFISSAASVLFLWWLLSEEGNSEQAKEGEDDEEEELGDGDGLDGECGLYWTVARREEGEGGGWRWVVLGMPRAGLVVVVGAGRNSHGEIVDDRPQRTPSRRPAGKRQS